MNYNIDIETMTYYRNYKEKDQLLVYFLLSNETSLKITNDKFHITTYGTINYKWESVSYLYDFYPLL